MKENKLGTYLTSFTEQDWSAYNKFSKSLYSNDSDYQLVINYIKKYKSRYDPSFMDSEYLRKKIRPAASKQVFSNVISGLCKHIEQYFTWAEVEKDTMMKDTLLLQALGKRGLSTQFHKHKVKSKERRSKMPIGLWDHYHDFMAEYLLYFCNMTSVIDVSKTALENSFSNISKFKETLNGYLGVEMHNRTTLLNENWNETSKNIRLNKIECKRLKDVYSHLMILKEKKKIASFKFLKSELFNDFLSDELRYTILIHLTSFINGQKVRGEINDGKEILQLYQFGLEKDLLFPNGLIPLIRYINIIGVACDVKKYGWANQFVINYSKLVASKSIEEIKTVGFAQIEFSKNNFVNVVNLLRNIKFKYFDVETRARWLLLSSNYEMNKEDYDLIDYYVLSYITFLKRNKYKTTKLKINGLKNSANYLSIITSGKNLSIVLENVKLDKTLYYRKWLISKIVEKMN